MIGGGYVNVSWSAVIQFTELLSLDDWWFFFTNDDKLEELELIIYDTVIRLGIRKQWLAVKSGSNH